jgi:pimeloyl-ACP methyl ester carboxylesterase
MNVLRTHPARMRLILITALLAVAGLLAVTIHGSSARAAGAAPQQRAGGVRPVIVLEHGSWADASSWDQVIRRLQLAGYTVYAPPDPLRGLSSDAADLNAFLTQNPALAGKPVVLVGHSYGGAVITDAAVGDSEVKALVYVDAFIPDQGQSIGQLIAAQPGSCIGGNPATVFNAVPAAGAPATDPDLYLQPAEFPGCFASGLPAGQAAVLAATQRPLADAAVTDVSGPPAWKTIPSWAVIGTSDQVIPPAELLAMAQHAGARVTDVPAGHLSLISDPAAVTRVIIEAAAATG